MTKPKLEFRQLTDEDVEAFRDIRLEALQKHPENFVSCHRQEGGFALAYFLELLHKNVYIACFKDKELLGICGVMPVHESLKMFHTGRITGFYVRPEYRGRGFAKKLMLRALDKAEQIYEKVVLNVNAKNIRAQKLYKSMGFEDIGLEKKALKLRDGSYINEFVMVKFLD